MHDESDRVLSLPQAAGIIYATGRPSPAQILRVKRRLECGVMKGTPGPGRDPHWTTTATSVAEYMAAETYRKQWSSAAIREKPELRGAYQRLLADYFQAVILRKRMKGASQRFQRAVVAGQVAMLVLILATAFLSLRPMFAQSAAERIAVMKWLDHNAPDFQVTQWFPVEDNPDGTGRVVRVQYRYLTPRGRAVHTDRRFMVQAGRIVEVESEW